MSQTLPPAYVSDAAMGVAHDRRGLADRANARRSAWPHATLGTRPLLFLYGVNGAVGTLGPARLYVTPGITWIDLVIAINFLILVDAGSGLRMSRRQAAMSLCVAGLALWLITSTVINAFWFPTYLSDVLPALKLLYFLVLIQVIRICTARFGVRDLVYGFLAGILALVLVDLQAASVYVVGVPVLTNTNVLGALLAFGIVFAAISILFTNAVILNLALALACLGLSITTFSKGTWLMCLFGVVALLVTLRARRRAAPRRARRARRRAVALAIVLMLGAAAYVVARNMDHISQLVTFKLESTTNQGTFALREHLIEASFRAGMDNPILGLGYRNFYEVMDLYPDLQLPPLMRDDNAHNLFAQTLAVGGFPALVLLILSVWAGLSTVPVALRRHMGRYWARLVTVLMIISVWILYGSVQLELIAQPPFWMFCGMMFGLSPQPSSAMRTPAEERA